MATVPLSSQTQKPDLSIPRFFATLKDPRRVHRRLHQLQDIIVIALCGVIAGAQDWQQIVTFGTTPPLSHSSATTVQATAICGGDTLNHETQGSCDIWLLVSVAT